MSLRLISKALPHKFGKRSGHHLVAQVAGQNPSRLLYMRDRKAGTSSLSILELRSAFFLLPPLITVGRRQNPYSLLMAPGLTLLDELHIDWLGFRKFNWYFVLADVNRPILGADFFCSYHLLIDVYTWHIFDAETYQSVPLKHDTALISGLNTWLVNSEFDDIIRDFPSVTLPCFSSFTVHRGEEHYIPTSGPPTYDRACPLLPDKLAIARWVFAEMEKVGIIRRSSST